MTVRALFSVPALRLLGCEIASARRRVRMTRADVATLSGLPLSVVADVELGFRPIPQQGDADSFAGEALFRIAGAIDTSATRWVARLNAISEAELQRKGGEPEELSHG